MGNPSGKGADRLHLMSLDELLLYFTFICNITDYSQYVGRFPITVPADGLCHGYVDGFTIFCQSPAFPFGNRPSHNKVIPFRFRFLLIRIRYIRDVFSDQLFLRVSKYTRKRRIDKSDLMRKATYNYRIRRRVEQRLKNSFMVPGFSFYPVFPDSIINCLTKFLFYYGLGKVGENIILECFGSGFKIGVGGNQDGFAKGLYFFDMSYKFNAVAVS